MLLGEVLWGTLLLLAASFSLMAFSYRKPWRLGILGCLAPAATVSLCYLLQLLLYQATPTIFTLAFGALALGMIVGIIRGLSHRIYQENNQIMAQRSIVYLLVWIVAFGATQILVLVSNHLLLIRTGFMTGAFSTGMVVVVSLILFIRYLSIRFKKEQA